MANIIELTIFFSLFWTSFCILGLSLFRMKVLSFVTQIALSLVPLVYISTLLQLYKVTYLSALIQPIAASICLYLIFRFRLLHAILIVVFVYCIQVFFEFFTTFAFKFFSMQSTLEYLQSEEFRLAYAIVVLNIILSYILQKYRFGFSFVNTRSKEPIAAVKLNQRMIFWVITSFVMLAVANLTVFFFSHYVILADTIIALLWLALFRLSYRREMEY
ncbi:hypothetical protein [Paenibacillus cremeus]|uniref:Uncharacterized protein n=1 Tax=Paenibacillus cremeus TaxID=2163881 RepID=A0A559K3H7_9BACL|nr:hypothetical protein [Paenibacillus cremeus]TVY06692.1 hypothetical protein FPZ49_28000 [Paenibacillus cremeus]